MTRFRLAAADEVAALQLVERRQQLWLGLDPLRVLGYDFLSSAVLTDHERVPPLRRSHDVDGIRCDPVSVLVKDFHRLSCTFLKTPLSSCDLPSGSQYLSLDSQLSFPDHFPNSHHTVAHLSGFFLNLRDETRFSRSQ